MNRLGMIFVVLVAIATLSVITLPATATPWELAAQSDHGLVRQYLDRDSIQQSGSEITVNSTYVDERSTPLRIDYKTTYDCASQQFKDIAVNDQPTDGDWYPLVDDPLNEAIRDLLCLQD